MTFQFSRDSFDNGISLLGGQQSEFISKAQSEFNFEHVHYEDNQILYEKKLFINEVNELIKYFNHELIYGPCAIMPRFFKATNSLTQDFKSVLSKSFDSRKSVILDSLSLHPYVDIREGDRAPAIWSRTLIILGASLLPLLNEKNIFLQYTRVIVVESNPLHLAIGLSSVDLSVLVALSRENNSSIQILLEEDPDKLKLMLADYASHLQPAVTFGSRIIKTLAFNPVLDDIKTWLLSKEGLTQDVRGSLGGEVDEVNQLLQSIINFSLNPSRKLIANKFEASLSPVILTGSGPSLDKYLPWLKEHSEHIQIVSAGSSLGTLLRNGIVPSAAVFLERQSVVYEKDILELVHENLALDQVTLIASMTIDPRISSLFGETVWFHRPASTAVAAFPGEISSCLVQGAPQSTNAALEAILRLGFKNIFTIGCDFGAENLSYPRSKTAAGNTIRNLSIPCMSKSKKPFFTSPELLYAARFFERAANIYESKISSPLSGLELKIDNLNIVDFSDPDLIKSLRGDGSLQFRLANLKHSSLTRSDIEHILEKAKMSLEDLKHNMLQIVLDADEWNIHLVRALEPFIVALRGDILTGELLINRLIKYPLFCAVMDLGDSIDSTDFLVRKARFSENINWISVLYDYYLSFLLDLLRDPLDQFDWPHVRSKLP